MRNFIFFLLIGAALMGCSSSLTGPTCEIMPNCLIGNHLCFGDGKEICADE